MTATITLHAVIRQARQRLECAGIEPAEAALDADVLARHALGGWERGQLLVNLREPAPPGLAERLEPLVARRERREPTAYITGQREFWGIEFDVAPGVLIPRPETEFIVEEALARLTPPADALPHSVAAREGGVTRRSPAEREQAKAGESQAVGCVVRIADICTGSGCIAVALARWLPTARIVATDVSEAALAIATRNVTPHEVADRVTLVRSDLLDPASGLFDLIVSNPPYVPSGDMATLQPEILNYEPRLALDAGPDGLDLIRRLVPAAATHLVPGGWFVFEFGDGQSARVREIIEAEPRLGVVAWRDDLAGIPRIAVACRVNA